MTEQQNYGVSSETVTPEMLRAGDHPTVEKNIVIEAASGALVRGTVLGKITKALGTLVPGTNTGGGTVSGIALGALAKIGNYVLTCIGGAKSASAGSCQGGGNGVLTLDASPVLTGCQVGVYKVVCIGVDTDSGVFAVFDPAGVYLGRYVVGAAAFATQIKFTIADGSSDFVAGAYFDITVARSVASGLGDFQVVDPDGVVIGTATAGTEFTHDQIEFTVTDGAPDFAVGDSFTIPVAAGNGRYKAYDADNVDGSQVADCILANPAANSAADTTPATAFVHGHFNSAALTGLDAAARLTLENKGIYIK
ncbi:MAG TPA: head decoration protein [bacterium]|nr:head decoration protein [bacterium]